MSHLTGARLLRFSWFDAAALACLGLVSCFMLRGYWIGEEVPPYDFLGGYLTTAYSWWDLGSFFDPPTFLPYLRGGYPAFLAVQASGWYLPVGFVAALVEYTPWSAAALQAFTVFLGAAGAFSLARRFGMRVSASFIAGLAYLFSPGFFESASYPDIVRTWAFFPWLLIAASAQRRITATRVVAASLLWFQFFVGAYPGGIAAAAYLCAAWVAVEGWRQRSRLGRYASWLTLTVIPAALMSALKWVPFVFAGQPVGEIDNQIVLDLSALGTLAFPLGDGAIPNPAGLQSFYVVPALILCIPFFERPRALVAGALGLCLVAVVLGADVPAAGHWQERLPLLNASRFRTADFRVGLVLGMVLLGSSGLDAILGQGSRRASRSWWQVRISISIALLAALTAVGLSGNYSVANTSKGVLWLGVSSAAVLGVLLLAGWAQRGRLTEGTDPDPAWRTAVLAGVFSIVVIGLGTAWAGTARGLWATPRESAELALAGAPVSTLISQQVPESSSGRPPRTGPPFPAQVGDPNTPGTLQFSGWNYGEYSRTPSMAGYANLRGQPWYLQLQGWTWNGDGTLWAALSRESTVWSLSSGEPVDASAGACLQDGTCEQRGLEVIRWSPASIEVRVTSARVGTVVVNEYAWPGWKVTSCRTDTCVSSLASADSTHVLLAAEVDSATTSIRFDYETPRGPLSWMCFWVGVSLLLLGMLTLTRLQSKGVE